MLQNDEYSWRRWLKLPKEGSKRGRRAIPPTPFMPLVYNASAAAATKRSTRRGGASASKQEL